MALGAKAACLIGASSNSMSQEAVTYNLDVISDLRSRNL
jgi:hypothetical protein